MGDFTGKVVIVTGGAKGIGRGISLAFADAGATVISADVDVEAGGEIVETAASLEGELIFKECDVSKGPNCKALVEAAVEKGGVHVLCNNVGIQPTSSYLPAHELPEEIWDRIIDVNLKSNFLMAQYAVPHMKRQGGGVIVNTASVQGLQSMKGVSAYAASKGGQMSLTRQLALEYAADNIRVLAVNPGTIDTPLVQEALDYVGGDHEQARQEMGKVHPLGRIGQPQEIANVVLFLASDKASFMTGEYVCVDGGMMAKGAWAG
jgi:NAD(P)-dependent dehydrogenase (short-subunit alcohol dehydrogenase family)